MDNIFTNNDYMKLIDEAVSASRNAYAPYSGFKVGAALYAYKSGQMKIFTGCNIENASYGATNCAERTAIFKAVSEGYLNIKAIAITSTGGIFTPPCGICRQVMAEFMENDADIILSENNNMRIYKLEDILPLSFTNKYLD